MNKSMLEKNLNNIDYRWCYTGTFSWKDKISFNDVDICFPAHRCQQIKDFLISHNFNHWNGDYFNSIKTSASFVFPNRHDVISASINIIFLSIKEIEIWKEATDIMNGFKIIPSNQNRRHAMFEIIRGLVKNSKDNY